MSGVERARQRHRGHTANRYSSLRQDDTLDAFLGQPLEQTLAGDDDVVGGGFDAENMTQPLGLLRGAHDSRMLSGKQGKNTMRSRAVMMVSRAACAVRRMPRA